MLSKIVDFRLSLAVGVTLAIVAVLACGKGEEAPVAVDTEPPPGSATAPQPESGTTAPTAARPVSGGAKRGTYVPPRQEPGVIFMPSLYEGPMPTTWQENPRFTAMIQNNEPFTLSNHKGVLPPLQDRVPIVEDRLVFDPPDEIGEYGGSWRMANSGWMIDHATMNVAGVVKRAADGGINTPYIMKDAVTSADGRTHTFTLRQGLKYSDGELLDIDNVRFANEGLNFNREKFAEPIEPCKDQVTGNWCKFDVIDDTHWTYTYDTPYYLLLEGEAGSRLFQYCRTWCIYASDYVRQFVPGYADSAELSAMIDEMGVEDWVSHLKGRLSVHGLFQKFQPQVGAWIQTSGLSVGSRLSSASNPYYHVFDPEGNQLPYLDGVESVGFESREVAVFRALAGESDSHTQIYRAEELPLYQANIVSGDFSLYAWPDTAGNDALLGVNQTYNEDPEIGRMMRQKDFRIALSLGIDRNEINELVFLGLGTPQNKVPKFTTLYFPGEEWAKLDTERDLDRANAILDSLGYVDTDGDGIRNRIGDLTGDGGNIRLFIGLGDDRFQSILQLLVAHWGDIGIDLDWKFNEQADRAIRDNVLYISIGGGHGDPDPFHGGGVVNRRSSGLGPLIGLFIETDGKEGMGPTGPDPAYLPLAPEGTYPADSTGMMIKMNAIIAGGKGYPGMHPKRIEAGKQYYRHDAEEKYNIGIIGFAPSFRGIQFKRNNFRNVQKHHAWDAIGYYSELFYFEDGMDNLHNPGNKSKRYSSESFLTGLTYN